LQFQKRRQLFIRVRNETLSVVAGASAIQIVRPLESTPDTQPQFQPDLLTLSALFRSTSLRFEELMIGFSFAS
jgi:hypothetical protein